MESSSSARATAPEPDTGGLLATLTFLDLDDDEQTDPRAADAQTGPRRVLDVGFLNDILAHQHSEELFDE